MLTKNGYKILLLSGCALYFQPSLAASNTKSGKPAFIHNAPRAKAALSQTKKAAPPHKDEYISVHKQVVGANGVTNTTPGGGLMPIQTAAKSVSGVSRDYIAKQSPTANAVTLLAMSPGVVVSTNDPLGLSDRMNVSIRGLNQTELGTTYEGMPAGDRLYYTPFATEWSDTENISHLDVSQGSPDIDAPVYNSVGGQIRASARQPSHKAGGYIDLSGGNKSLNRQFIRLDSGEIGHTGIRNYTSFSHTEVNNWRGSGNTKRYHVDSHFLKEWGHNSIAPFFAWNWMRTDVYTNPTLSQWKQYGISYNYAGKYSYGTSNYYKLRFNQRQNVIAAIPTEFELLPDLTFKITPYIMYTRGFINSGANINGNSMFVGDQSVGTVQLPYSVNNVATVENVDAYTQTAGGQNATLTWKHKFNTLQVGYWYDYFDHNENTSYTPVEPNGNVMNEYGGNPIKSSSGTVIGTYNGHLIQQTNAIFINDTMKFFNDRLVLNAGFKEVMVSRHATSALPGPTYAVNKNDAEPLPQLSVSYRITPHDQVYFSASTAFKEPAALSAYVDIYSATTGKKTSSHSSNLKPEYSISEEIGYRHYGAVNFSAAAFNYNLTNRQISSITYVNNSPQSFSVNGGGQTIRGVQAELSLPAWHHFSPYISGQYLHSEMGNNIQVGNDYLPTKGKASVLAPKFTGSIGLSYDDTRFFGNFTFNYVDSQYSTFMNDQSIPAFKTANLSAGYRFQKIGPAQHPQIQLNLMNIGDEHYLSGVNGIATNAHATKGIFGTAIAAGTPTYYVGGDFAVAFSLSSDF